MKKRAFIFLLSLIYIASFVLPTQLAYADDSKKKEEQKNPLGFSYKVIKPDNQQNPQVGYYDLRMTPGQKQTVQIDLTNDGDQEVEVEVSINGAKTNGNGVIEYGPSSIDNDKSLKYDFKEVVKGEESVKIPPKTTVPLKLAITMPESSYDGMISGGIEMKRHISKEEQAKQKGVVNEYAFLVGMVLTETDTTVQPELELNKVYAGLSNYRNSIFVNLSNIEAAILDDLTLDVQIMSKESDSVIYDTKKAGMRFAPNSMMDFPISMNGEKMVPGKYRAHVLATSKDRKWEWTEEFTITDEDADKYNKQDVNLVQEQGINWKLIVPIVAGVFILGLIIFFVVRTLNKKRATKKKKAKKSKRR
ncbi:DUF916 and DUF3324 domain-containing protein [Enterococcus crotali]|uniref:DUF916 and DUF3324 domain-containing protein n=1 Tax=Enterococcus crotali TaxID=1453587 RepID=UPI00046EFB2A|nr:DUF916 and DUF3324 domain-containing protein [Enterococcus crotali]